MTNKTNYCEGRGNSCSVADAVCRKAIEVWGVYRESAETTPFLEQTQGFQRMGSWFAQTTGLARSGQMSQAESDYILNLPAHLIVNKMENGREGYAIAA